ncbi:MAG TPA: selenocysteine-specific translation elongation factor [Burkholderiaceae bacterium]|nr:selenocysteine-specific translation elongation factor [Burkholderiaceae bacterium]
MIVGTAGHIDHGKTTLVRALTGVDTDRLPEEKRRGISIELGYAFMDVPGGERIGFVDVPGHERLVHTMLAGATGIDHGLLLVAADDGVMPQTREHLAVLSLMGLRELTVVLTKADRVDADRLEAVKQDVQALLARTPVAGAPCFAVSATTGQGMAALRDYLHVIAARHSTVRPPHADQARVFRLAIDRAFTLDGVGTVVTGTVHAGEVRVGDELVLVPDATEQRLRVRSIHAQNREAEVAVRGQRCALGLAGLARDAVRRGQWITEAAAALSTDRIDTELTLWSDEPRALKTGTPVHVHLGSASVMGSVAVLDADSLKPGETACVQIVLHEPVGAWHGDRVVLRDASASRTIAGGRVLDPFGPVRYRRTAQRLAELKALAEPCVEQRLAGVLAESPAGLDLQRFATAQGLRNTPAPPEGAVEATGWLASTVHAQAAQDAILAALDAFHQKHPDELGPDLARLRRLSLPRLPDPVFRAWISALRAQERLGVLGACAHLPAHAVKLSASEERLRQKLGPALEAAGFEGAWARDLARDGGENEVIIRTTLSRLAQRGELHQVVKDLFYPAPTMAQLAQIVRDIAARNAEVSAASFRDATGLGRKRAIQILEYLDRIGMLQRVGDVHRLRKGCRLFMGEDALA